MLRKRGTLGWIFLGLAIISLVLAALLVFISSDRNFGSRSSSFASIAAESTYASTYSHNALQFIVTRSVHEADPTNFLFTFEQRFVLLMNEYDPGDGRFGTFFAIARNKEYILTESDGIYTLTLPGVEHIARVENHIIHKTFDLSIRFTPNGLLS